MEVLKDYAEITSYVHRMHTEGKTIGLVPTMGALHAGHITLFTKCLSENDVCIGTIFVNPLQFNNAADLEKYPRTIEKDLEMLEKAGCHCVFIPSVDTLYPEASRMHISFGALEATMEGAFRPGHFNGVAIVVAKFFNIIQPQRAYFGQKDLQQFAIIRRLVKDLSFPVELVCCAIMREDNGLAMSSRNIRLSAEGRTKAASLSKALKMAEELLSEIPLAEVKNAVHNFLKKADGIEPEYFEIVDAGTLEPVKNVEEHSTIALCIAAYVEGVRLIDNMIIIS